VVAVVLLPRRAPAAEAEIEAARKHMEKGQEAFHQQRFEEAARHFEDAFNASPFSAFLYNAGLAEERVGNFEKAVAFYRRYLKEDPEAADAGTVREKIDALLAAISQKPPEGEPVPGSDEPGVETPTAPAIEITQTEMKSLISIRTNPKDATIRIISQAGAEVGTSTGPLAQTVEGGTYTIEASHPDYKTVTTDIFVAPGQVYVVVVEMSQGAFLGFLRVLTDPPGAAVFIDDKRLGQAGATPFSNVVPTGLHRVWVEKTGYVPVEKEIRVDVSEEVEFNAPLERPTFGALIVKTNIDGAAVHVDGKPAGAVGLTTPFRKQLPVGKHTVTVTRDGMKDYTQQVEVTAGQERKLLVRLNAKPSRTSGWVSAGFSVAVFAAGGVLGSFALRTKNELEADRKDGRLASDDNRILKGFLFGIGADVSFGVGTVIACMSLYYFLRDPLPPSEGKTQDPVDYDLQADRTGAPVPEKPARKTADTPTAGRFILAPLLGPETAGLSLAVTF
jgi:hypothetical protein